MTLYPSFLPFPFITSWLSCRLSWTQHKIFLIQFHSRVDFFFHRYHVIKTTWVSTGRHYRGGVILSWKLISTVSVQNHKFSGQRDNKQNWCWILTKYYRGFRNRIRAVQHCWHHLQEQDVPEDWINTSVTVSTNTGKCELNKQNATEFPFRKVSF